MEAYSLRAPVGKERGRLVGAHVARDEGVAAMLVSVLAAALVDVATFATTAETAETSASLFALFRRRLRRRLCSGRGAEIELRHAELE